MRNRFELENLQPFYFQVGESQYTLSDVRTKAEKRNMPANVFEYIFELPDGTDVWLTLVGDEDETGPYGIHKGWYTVVTLSDSDARFLIDAFSKFTAEYQ